MDACLVVPAYFYKCSHARFLVEVVFFKMVVDREVNFCQCSCSPKKRCARMLAKTIRYPFISPGIAAYFIEEHGPASDIHNDIF